MFLVRNNYIGEKEYDVTGKHTSSLSDNLYLSVRWLKNRTNNTLVRFLSPYLHQKCIGEGVVKLKNVPDVGAWCSMHLSRRGDFPRKRGQVLSLFLIIH